MKKLWYATAALFAITLTSGCNGTASSGSSGTTAPGSTTPVTTTTTSQSSQPTTDVSASPTTSTPPATTAPSRTTSTTATTPTAKPSQTTPAGEQSTSPGPSSSTFPQHFTGKATKPETTLTVTGNTWTFDAGCNLIQVSTNPPTDASVTITSTSVTKMSCPDRNDEEAVLAWLKEEKLTFRFTGNKLTLSNTVNTITFTKS